MSEPVRPPNVFHGGDKLAFVIPGGQKGTPESAKVLKIIEEMRKEKRDLKAALEQKKETQLVPYDNVTKAFRKAKLDLKKAAAGPDEEAARRRQLDPHIKSLSASDQNLADKLVVLSEEEVNAQRKSILRAFDKEVGRTAGWSLVVLSKRLAQAGFTIDPEPNPANPNNSYAVVTADGTAVCAIHSGTNKLKAVTADGGLGQVFRARGTSKLPEAQRRRKEYVKDGHQIATRRYVTRAISFYHLANMFGKTFNPDSLKREWAGRVPQWVNTDTDGQEPRAREHTLESQSTHFDVTQRAKVVPGSNWSTEVKEGQIRLPSGQVGIVDQGPASGPMTPDERASMQVRDGSGDRQQGLSATAVQSAPDGYDDKVIRGNKGERFDLGPETVAVVEIDLSIILAEQISTLNQHSFASHEYKSAYLRYMGATDHSMKRRALDELSEYVYSAQKNREVVMDKIPNRAITRIQLAGMKKWEYLGGSPIAVKTWHDFKEVSPALLAFVKDVDNLTKLRDRAEPKMEERGSRT